MGLFDNIKQKKDIEKLEKAISENPSSENYCALIKKYCETNDQDNALRVANQAMDRYPDNDGVFELYSRLRKNQAHNEIEGLKKIVEQRPNHVVFIQLAEIHNDLRDEEMALKYCKQAIELFPNHDSPYSIIGQMRLRRFYKDYLLKDGQLAVTNLEKSVSINPRNYKALLALAKFYLQIGAITRSEDRLGKILRFSPEDENVKQLLEICKKIPRQSYEDVDILLRTVEDQRKLYYNLNKDQEEAPSIKLTPEMFQSSVETLNKNSEGLYCVLICDEQGTLINNYAVQDVDVNILYEVAKTILKNVQDSSRQMDMGRFQRIQIESAVVNIHIVLSGGVVYVAFGAKEVKPDQIYRRLQQFISQVSINLRK